MTSGLHRRLAAGLLGLTLVCAPLLFGGATPGGRAALQMLALIALALMLRDDDAVDDLRRAQLPALAVAGVALWGLLQSLPWPRAALRALSPAADALWRDAHALLGDAVGAPMISDAAWFAPSLAPVASRAAALQWFATAAAFLAAAALGRQRDLRRLLLSALIVGGVAQAIFGGIQRLRGVARIWGVEVPGDPARLRGTFVNPDHAAYFLGLTLCVAFSWLVWNLRRGRRYDRFDDHLLRIAAPVLVCVVLSLGVVFTGSRGGLVATLGALVGQSVLLVVAQRRHQADAPSSDAHAAVTTSDVAAWSRARRLAPLGAAALGLALIGVALAVIGPSDGLRRWRETAAYDLATDGRRAAYADGLALGARFPLVGVGLGVFGDAFPMVQRPSLGGTWQHLHSDVLELWITGGVPAVLLMLIGGGALARRLLHARQRGRRSEDRAVAVAGLGVAAFAGAFALVDFGITTPANGYAVAIVLGLAFATPCGRLAQRRPGRRVPIEASAAPSATMPLDAPSVAERDRARAQDPPRDQLDFEQMRPIARGDRQTIDRHPRTAADRPRGDVPPVP
ncbi:MAG: O-antigen ligase family protein [Acidobacteriota bacterium]